MPFTNMLARLCSYMHKRVRELMCVLREGAEERETWRGFERRGAAAGMGWVVDDAEADESSRRVGLDSTAFVWDRVGWIGVGWGGWRFRGC